MILAIDVGSSSVKAALLDGTTIVGDNAYEPFVTTYRDLCVEVDAVAIDEAIRRAVARLDIAAASSVGITGMAPAWLAMDEHGRAMTPIITHQDRRSTEVAHAIEERIGRKRGYLRLTGNVATPGGISVTTASWVGSHSNIIDRCSMMGHLPTSLMKRLTGEWAIDPSNAGFTGLLDVQAMKWSKTVCDAAQLPMSKLPPIVDAASVVGQTVANDLSIPIGLPVFGGYVDGSGPLLLTGATPGTLMHSAGSTDVLAVCVDRPIPTKGLLCRPLGSKNLWVLAATQAAGASSIGWIREMLFADLDTDTFTAELRAAAKTETSVTFRPCLAGDRQKIDQSAAGLEGLTLATTRKDILAAVVQGLVADHVKRFDRLMRAAGDVDSRVVTTGGAGAFRDVLRAAWPNRPDGQSWAFEEVEQATLRGLGALNSGAAPKA